MYAFLTVFFPSDLLNPQSQNHAKILLDGLTLMKDPCRRFAFGFTLEGLRARLYFFSRCVVMVSEQFNINEVHSYL
jgi:hypothetical protein